MSSPPITRQIESPATYFGAGISGGDPEDLSTVNRVRSDTSNVIVRIVSCPTSSTSPSSPTAVPVSSSAQVIKRKSASAVDCLQATINKLQKRVRHLPTLALLPSTSSSSTMAPEYDNSDDSDVPLIVDETTPPTSPAPAEQQPPTTTPPLVGPPALLPHYDAVRHGYNPMPITCPVDAKTTAAILANFTGWLHLSPSRPIHQERGAIDEVRTRHWAEAMSLDRAQCGEEYYRNDTLATYDILVNKVIALHFDFAIGPGDHLILAVVPLDPAAEAQGLNLCRSQHKQKSNQHQSHRGQQGIFGLDKHPFCPDMLSIHVAGHDVWQLRPARPVHTVHIFFRCPSVYITPKTNGSFSLVAQGTIRGVDIATAIPIRIVLPHILHALLARPTQQPPPPQPRPAAALPPPPPPLSRAQQPSAVLHYYPQPQYLQQPIRHPGLLSYQRQQQQMMPWQQQQQQPQQRPPSYPVALQPGQRQEHQQQQQQRQMPLLERPQHLLPSSDSPPRHQQASANVSQLQPQNLDVSKFLPMPDMPSAFHTPNASSQGLPPSWPNARGPELPTPLPPPFVDPCLVQRVRLAYLLEVEKAALSANDVHELLSMAQFRPILPLRRYHGPRFDMPPNA
ncbi:unnamed protein product [Sphagnum tenellum]